MIDLTCQSVNQPTSKYLFTLWCTVAPPGLLVSQQHNIVVYVNYNNYTGENHAAYPTFLDLTNVRLNKEMGSNLANFGRWPTAIFTPDLTSRCVTTLIKLVIVHFFGGQKIYASLGVRR